MKNPQNRRFRFALPVFILIAALGFGAIVQWLWNAVLPAAANFNTITYWQAVGLFVLCKILFGGFKGPGGHPHRHKWQRFNGRFGRGGREERGDLHALAVLYSHNGREADALRTWQVCRPVNTQSHAVNGRISSEQTSWPSFTPSHSPLGPYN